MITETTTEPNGPVSTSPSPKSACCGGGAAVRSRDGTSIVAEHDHSAQAPSDVARSSCCCGDIKEASAAGPKERSAASKCR